jgi:hypothetical protein
MMAIIKNSFWKALNLALFVCLILCLRYDIMLEAILNYESRPFGGKKREIEQIIKLRLLLRVI